MKTVVRFFYALPVLLLLFSVVKAQTPRFSKYDIAETGSAAYFPAEPTWDFSWSEDSSEVYTAEVEVYDVSYGTIMVRFAEPIGDDPDLLDEMLASYMGFLNENAFELTGVVDPGYGHTLESHAAARGIIQYGEDAGGSQFAIKGWIDSEVLAVMYVYFSDEMNTNFQDLFLNGFRFPEE